MITLTRVVRSLIVAGAFLSQPAQQNLAAFYEADGRSGRDENDQLALGAAVQAVMNYRWAQVTLQDDLIARFLRAEETEIASQIASAKCKRAELELRTLIRHRDGDEVNQILGLVLTEAGYRLLIDEYLAFKVSAVRQKSPDSVLCQIETSDGRAIDYVVEKVNGRWIVSTPQQLPAEEVKRNLSRVQKFNELRILFVNTCREYISIEDKAGRVKVLTNLELSAQGILRRFPGGI